MGDVKELECVICHKKYPPNYTETYCPSCGPNGILDVHYDYGPIANSFSKESLAYRREPTLWRYREVLPITKEEAIQPLSVGWTPLYNASRLAASLGVSGVWVKDDGRNPTASFKDRASAIGVARAIELGHRTITAASTGNAASSLAGFAACAGLEAYIFVPQTAPIAKITQLLIYGAHVLTVDGTYDEAWQLCLEASEKWGWYNRSCAINPYLVEGKKTVGWEICEQLNWQVPDYVVMSVGDGCSIAGAWKGFWEAYQLGFTSKLPKMIGVQAKGCEPLTRSYKLQWKELPSVTPATLADSIAVGIPRNATKAINAIRDSQGMMVSVEDHEILEAMTMMARLTGIFGEPAAVTGLAGLRKALSTGELDKAATFALVVTGSGLKDITSAQKAVNQPFLVKPTIDSVEKVLRKIK